MERQGFTRELQKEEQDEWRTRREFESFIRKKCSPPFDQFVLLCLTHAGALRAYSGAGCEGPFARGLFRLLEELASDNMWHSIRPWMHCDICAGIQPHLLLHIERCEKASGRASRALWRCTRCEASLPVGKHDIEALMQAGLEQSMSSEP